MTDTINDDYTLSESDLTIIDRLVGEKRWKYLVSLPAEKVIEECFGEIYFKEDLLERNRNNRFSMFVILLVSVVASIVALKGVTCALTVLLLIALHNWFQANLRTRYAGISASQAKEMAACYMLLNNWNAKTKKAILENLGSYGRIFKEYTDITSKRISLTMEIEKNKEMIATYEKIITEHDQISSNLRRVLGATDNAIKTTQTKLH